MVNVVAVANAKGGTAKTTTTVALAAEAAHRGHRSLVIDLDVQANATDQLLAGESDAGRAVYQTVVDGDPLVAQRSVAKNLWVAPAGKRTQHLADALARTVREALPEELADAYNEMRSTMHQACADYDWVFIDTPPSEQSAALLDFVYAAATHLILPTKIDQNSTAAVSSALRHLVRLSRRDAQVADPLGIVLVDVDTQATRLVAAAHASVAEIGGVVAPFATVIGHRSGPVAYARQERMTPRQFAAAAEGAHLRRFSALKEGRKEENPAWNAASAQKLVSDYEALFSELAERIESSR